MPSPVEVERIVVLCRYLPDPTKSSGELRFAHLLRQLRGHCGRLEVFCETGGNAELHDLPVYGMDELAGRCPGADLAFLEFWFMDAYMQTLRDAGVPILLDSVDVEFVRRARERDLLGLPDGAYREEERRERRAYREADQIWVVSRPDGDRLADLEDKLVVVPNIFEPVEPVPGFDERRGAVFVGSYHHQPNVDGLRWYRDAVMPRLSDTEHRFIGHGSPDDIAGLPGFVGGVDDSTEYVRRARVSIAPLRYGAGLKGKVLEAMACGTPVVTTAIGDEGYEAGRRGAALVTSDPADFADAVRRLESERELWERMSAAALEVAADYRPEVVARVVDAALERLLAGCRRVV